MSRTATGKYKSRGDLMLAVLDWVLEEQLAGRRPNDIDVSKKFELTIEEATELHDELDEMGELG